MKNAMLISIRICIHSTIGYSVTKILSIPGLWDGTPLKTAVVTRVLAVIPCRSRSTNTAFLPCAQGTGVQCLLCLFRQRHKTFRLALCFALLYASCIIPSCFREFKINFKTCKLLIGFWAQEIRPYTHILVQCLYPVIRVPLQAVKCNYFHCTVQL